MLTRRQVYPEQTYTLVTEPTLARSLKTKLDHMMHLLNKQHQEEDEEISSANGSSPKGDFASLVKLSDGAASRDRDHDHDEDAAVIDMQQQLRKLQVRNMLSIYFY